MDLVKRYIRLAWRDAGAAHPDKLLPRTLAEAIARYEAALPAAETAGFYKGRADMASKSEENGAEESAPVEEKKTKRSRLKGKIKAKKGKAKVKKTKKAKAVAGRLRTGVGETIRALIKKNQEMSNADVAERAKKAHPDSSTNAQCVAWYRNDMRKKGDIRKAA